MASLPSELRKQLEKTIIATRRAAEVGTLAGLDPKVMNNMALWLASDESGGVNGCRFSAKHWDDSLVAAEAAEKCRDAPLFPVPLRPTKLDLAWTGTERGTVATQKEIQG